MPLALRPSRPYVLRAIHTWTGVVPLALFCLIHVGVQATAVAGRDSYEQAISQLNASSLIRGVQMTLVLLPLLIHAAIGLTIIAQTRPNVRRYPTSGNWALTAQRATGLAALAFVVTHIAQVSWPAVDAEGRYDLLVARMSSTIAGVPVNALIHSLGTGFTVFHALHGVYRVINRYGDGSVRRQRWVGAICMLLGVVAIALSVNTVATLAAGGPIW